MHHPPPTVAFLLCFSTILSAPLLLSGCGGGSGGNSPSPTPGPPSPFDASYNAIYTPSKAIPADGQTPTGSLNVIGGRATLRTTFFLQQSVVDAVQKAINNGLNNAGQGGAILDNQVPQSIAFSGTGQLDASGKLVLIAKKSVDVCGTATLTIDPSFTASGNTSSGTGSYQITFPSDLTLQVRGRKVSVSGTCNNLPLRSGAVAFTK